MIMKNGNESIYPSEKLVDGGHPMLDNVKVKTKGLTKREYFAGLAMQGLLAKEGVWSSDEILAQRSIEIADELLKQLEK